MAAFVDQLFNQTSVPVLSQVMQFTAARHELLVHNIANIDTPGFRPQDLSPADFQQAMAKALKNRQANGGRLTLRGEQVVTGHDGRLQFRPREKSGVLFHDQAKRNVEQEMAHLAENTLTYNMAAELLKQQFNTLRTAIRQRL